MKDEYKDLTYSFESLPLMDFLDSLAEENIFTSGELFTEQLTEIETALNIIYELGVEHSASFTDNDFTNKNKAHMLLLSTYHKNIIALYTAIKLTRNGLYGPARSMLRHVFEALLISKFCALTNENSIFEKWKAGDILYLTNGVLKKISTPDTEVFSEFWGFMSNYSHATKYAQQVSLNIKNDPDESQLNLVYISILLECQYHLLNRHLITSSMRDFIKKYRPDKDPVPELRSTINEIFKSSRGRMLKRPKQLIKSYCSTWKFIE